VGSAGIKRRKKTRRANAKPAEPMSEGDVQRLFGRFTWNQYSPAGTLERNGFFWRQLNRYPGRAWRIPALVMRIGVLLFLAVTLVWMIVQLIGAVSL
jgi:hypothetical protein